jgi:hypothetical protein
VAVRCSNWFLERLARVADRATRRDGYRAERTLHAVAAVDQRGSVPTLAAHRERRTALKEQDLPPPSTSVTTRILVLMPPALSCTNRCGCGRPTFPLGLSHRPSIGFVGLGVLPSRPTGIGSVSFTASRSRCQRNHALCAPTPFWLDANRRKARSICAAGYARARSSSRLALRIRLDTSDDTISPDLSVRRRAG